jgi:hypothetical protein
MEAETETAYKKVEQAMETRKAGSLGARSGIVGNSVITESGGFTAQSGWRGMIFNLTDYCTY